MDFNNILPEWENEGTEPSDNLKSNGFAGGYKPPASVFNWFWSKVTKAITELQTKLGEAETAFVQALNYKSNTGHTHTLDEVTETETKKAMTNEERTKLAGIQAGATKTVIESTITNSSNPVSSTAIANALALKSNVTHVHNNFATASFSLTSGELSVSPEDVKWEYEKGAVLCFYSPTSATVVKSFTLDYGNTSVTCSLNTLNGNNAFESYAFNTNDLVVVVFDTIDTCAYIIAPNQYLSHPLYVHGQQMLNFNNYSATIGTNNATNGVTICCGSEATVNVNGSKISTGSIVPRATTSYQIGNSSLRYNGIYLVSSPNVSSDERLKKNIKSLDQTKLSEFINKLNVVEYQYLGEDDQSETKRIGLIAQDIIAADSELAKYFVEQGEEGYYGLKPTDLIFPLIAAVKELSREVEELKQK